MVDRDLPHYGPLVITLPKETEVLAARLATARNLSIETAIRRALEEQARASGLETTNPRRRMSVEDMLALGAEIVALPLLDRRSPEDIMDGLDPL